MSKEFSFEQHLKAVEFELWTNIQDWGDQDSPKIVLEDLQDAYDHIVTAMNILAQGTPLATPPESFLNTYYEVSKSVFRRRERK